MRTAHSGWVWSSPQPQGQTIRAIEFDGARGYAAGRLGTVLLTDDKGLDWRGARTGTTVELTQLSVPAPGTVIAAGDCEVIRSDDGGVTFAALPWISSASACPAPVAALDFADAQNGYLVLANGAVRATGDGGLSWNDRMGIPQTVSDAGAPDAPLAASFSGLRTGLAVTSGGVVYRTFDGAATWKPVSSGHPPLRTVVWASGATAYAAGDGGMVLRTVDGGATWSQLTSVPADVAMIRCASVLDCIAVAADGRSVLRTRNGGVTYSQAPSGDRRLFAAAFASPSDLVAAGEAGSTAVSSDGGLTWSRLGGELETSFSRVRVFSGDLAVAAGRAGALATSTDGGQTWADAPSPTQEEVIDVVYRDLSHGYLLDAMGATYRTLDGAAWERLRTGGAAYPQAVLAPSPNVVVLIGPEGDVALDRPGRFLPARERTAGAALQALRRGPSRRQAVRLRLEGDALVRGQGPSVAQGEDAAEGAAGGGRLRHGAHRLRARPERAHVGDARPWRALARTARTRERRRHRDVVLRRPARLCRAVEVRR